MVQLTHYRPAGRGTPCGAFKDWYNQDDSQPRPQSTTNVARVTCSACLRYIKNTASTLLRRNQ